MCKEQKYFSWRPIIVALAIPIVIVGLTCLANKLGCQIKCSDSILTLIGVLATFVVISNYLQTQSAQKQFQNELSQHRITINEEIRANKEDLKSEIKQIYDKQKDADITIATIQNAIETFYSNNHNSKNIDASSFKNIYSQKKQ